MGLIPAEKKKKFAQFFIWIWAGIFWFVAGCCWFDEHLPWYQRIGGIVGTLILVSIFIVVGYWMIYLRGS